VTFRDDTLRIPIFAGLLAAILFGAATPASKSLLVSLSPFQLAGLLYLGAAIGVIPILIRERQLVMPWRLPAKTRLHLGGAILFGGFIGPVLLLLGLRIASSASVSLWLNLELVATAVLGHYLFKDQITKTSAIAVAGTLLAAMLLSFSEGSAGILAGLLILLACASWGFDNHFTAIIDEVSPAQTTFWKGLIAGPVNFGIGWWMVGSMAAMPEIGMGLLVGVFAYGISIVLYITSAQQLGATRSQIIFSSSPFFGVLLSWLWLGESITGLQFLAMAIIAVSLLILVMDQHSHSHHHHEMSHAHWHQHDDDHHDHDHPSGKSVQTRWHTHRHDHRATVHNHLHWPDLHHRHVHQNSDESTAGDADRSFPGETD
jgi:drug/metabolite transporter (DMT)-like permease